MDLWSNPKKREPDQASTATVSPADRFNIRLRPRKLTTLVDNKTPEITMRPPIICTGVMDSPRMAATSTVTTGTKLKNTEVFPAPK